MFFKKFKFLLKNIKKKCTKFFIDVKEKRKNYLLPLEGKNKFSERGKNPGKNR